MSRRPEYPSLSDGLAIYPQTSPSGGGGPHSISAMASDISGSFQIKTEEKRPKNFPG